MTLQMPKAIIGYCDSCECDTTFNHVLGEIVPSFEKNTIHYECENDCGMVWGIPVQTGKKIEIC